MPLSLTGLGGGAASLFRKGAGGNNEWNPSNLPTKADSNVSMTIMSGYPNILQIYYPTTVSNTSSSNTTTNAGQHTLVNGFDFSTYGSTSVTFYGIGAGGGGNIGPCSNGSGGAGSAFKIVVPAGHIRLSSVTLKSGQRGRGGHQQTPRGNISSAPWGVSVGAYAGGRTESVFNDGSLIYAGGGQPGDNDSCTSGLPGGGGNEAGGLGGSSGSLSFATFNATYFGGSGTQSGHNGCSGGGAAFPGGYINGTATAGSGGASGAGDGGDGTYGQGGNGCTVLSNAGATSSTLGGQTGNPPGAAIMGGGVYSGDSGGFGGGGGNAETDGGLNTYAGYGGHGGMGAIFIELT
tara:strand:+ start:261 stop:1304 length:1044 start_codon:yes stop_codon:yes gene_type:complete